MADVNYNKRELDMKFLYLGEKVDNNHKETKDQIDLLDRKTHDKHVEILGFLTEIKEQGTKSAAKSEERVNTVQDQVDDLQEWKAKAQGALIIFGSIILPVILAIVYLFLNNINK